MAERWCSGHELSDMFFNMKVEKEDASLSIARPLKDRFDILEQDASRCAGRERRSAAEAANCSDNLQLGFLVRSSYCANR
jgi:hypothetical protein